MRRNLPLSLIGLRLSLILKVLMLMFIHEKINFEVVNHIMLEFLNKFYKWNTFYPSLLNINLEVHQDFLLRAIISCFCLDFFNPNSY